MVNNKYLKAIYSIGMLTFGRKYNWIMHNCQHKGCWLCDIYSMCLCFIDTCQGIVNVGSVGVKTGQRSTAFLLLPHTQVCPS